MKSALTRPAALGLLLLAACRDAGPTGPDGSPDGPGYLISDATHQGGVPQFYWLPPTVPNPGPTVTGTFDGDLLGGAGVYPQLEVRICPAGSATLCPASGAGSLKSFNAYSTTPAITKDQANQNYQLNWNKPSLTAGNTYRAWALVTVAANASPLPLGYADVKVVANSKALKQVNLNQFVGLIVGNPLYLKFTVRTGIAGAISVALGSSVLAPGGTTTATATVTDLHGAALAGVTVNWGVTPAANPPGSVSPGSSATGSGGTATATLTAGSSAGSGEVVASVGTAPGQLSGTAPFTVNAGGALVAGGFHTCGITSSGETYCWGQNIWGELGNGSTSPSPLPVAVTLPAGVTGFSRLAVGSGHTCALTISSAVYCWGSDEFYQLGYEDPKSDSPVPVAVDVPAGGPFSEFAAKSAHTCVLNALGTVYCWGDLGAPMTGYASVAPGGLHHCGITTTGVTTCWGMNVYGQLGDGTDDNSFVDPVAVVLPAGVGGFTSLAAGGIHTCALTSAGAAYCWGSNTSGQLGNPVTPVSEVPVAVTLPAGVALTSLSAGNAHTCGLTPSGAAYCWGGNEDGQLGNSSTADSPIPVEVVLPAGVNGFASLSAGGEHTCGVTATGAAYCWGNNDDGQLGDNSTTDRLTPQAVGGGLTFLTQ